jgi:putative spermidine/putrescine transport system permease protein
MGPRSGALWVPYIGLILVLLTAPIIIIVLYSFSPSRYMQVIPSGVSLKWYVLFFKDPSFMLALKNTAILSVSTLPLCVMIALPTAHSVARKSVPGAELIGIIMSSTLILPGVVTGIAFLSLFNFLHVDNGLIKMTVAMTVVCLPYAVHALIANYRGIDVSLEEAARDLGAKSFYTYFRVVLPQLKPGIIAGGIFVLVETIDNFAVNVFLADGRTVTLPIATYERMRTFDDPTVAVIATMMAGVALILLALLAKLVGLDRALTEGN